MASRLAYTAGGVVLITADGSGRRMPAGACWIVDESASRDIYTVRWGESGGEQTARVSGEHLRTYLRGCMIQYA
jgi:hypothetical protein